MASSNQLLARLQHLESLGVLDDSTRHLYSLKQYQDDPQYFLDTLLKFLHDSAATLDRMEVNLRENLTDFSELAKDSMKILGSSASIGAFRVKWECWNLQLAAEICSKTGCLQAWSAAKREYVAVKPHLEGVIQLELDIISSQG